MKIDIGELFALSFLDNKFAQSTNDGCFAQLLSTLALPLPALPFSIICPGLQYTKGSTEFPPPHQATREKPLAGRRGRGGGRQGCVVVVTSRLRVSYWPEISTTWVRVYCVLHVFQQYLQV